MSTPTPDLAGLRAACEAATPGPWDLHMVHPDMSGNHQYGLRGATRGPAGAVIGNTFRASSANANFIAAANPTAILVLLDALAVAEAERDEARAAADLAQTMVRLHRPDPVGDEPETPDPTSPPRPSPTPATSGRLGVRGDGEV